MEPAPTSIPVAPLEERARFRSLDILRGVAVLGIFVMNSRNFALPLEQFDNPAFPERAGSPAAAADLWTWAVSNVFFEDKMIALFSMLFGAGVLLQSERLGRGFRAACIHVRRMFWLLVMGLIHMFGLWYGDILATYAVCGLVVYPFRRFRPAVLIGLGVLVLTVAMWVRVGPRMMATIDPPPVVATGAAARPSAPESLRTRLFREATQNEEAAYRGSYLDLFRWRARLNIVWNGLGGIDFSLWRSVGFMLIGMGLIAIFSGSRPASVAWGLFIGGYAAGLLLIALGFWPQLARALGRAPHASAEARQMLGAVAGSVRFLGAACLAVGHVGLILLLCRCRRLGLVLIPIAAAGRMALSNYLLQTVIAVIIFDGWALGHWGRWHMSQIITMVGCVWAAQLVLSPMWLQFFRFGPAEWAWRSLTYWRVQPLRRRVEVETAPL